MKAKINDESDKIAKLANISETRTKQVEAMQEMSKKAQDDLNRARKRFSDWKVNAVDEVARMKNKGKLENIDKAGLRDVLND